MTLWKQAFRADPDLQTPIIELLASGMPAEAFLDYFSPDRVALGKLYRFYRLHQAAEASRLVGLRYVAELELEAQHSDGSDAAWLWDQAREVHGALGDARKAAQAGRNAVFHSPDDFDLHRRLAMALSNGGEYAEAVAELQWCLSRRPQEAGLQQQLEQANRQRLSSPARIVR